MRIPGNKTEIDSDRRTLLSTGSPAVASLSRPASAIASAMTMMRTTLAVAVACLTLGGIEPAGAATGAPAQPIALTGATIIDGIGKAAVTDGVLVIADGKIAAVGRSRDVAIPAGAKKLDVRGKYIIPGLMDANVHLHYSMNLQQLIKYEDRLDEIALEGAQIALKYGVTTVFDTWGPRAALAKARDAIDAGTAPGSRVYIAGNILGMDGIFSDDWWGNPPENVSGAFVKRINETWEQGVGRRLLGMTPEEVRSALREYTKTGVNFFKYFGTGHLDTYLTFSPRVLKVIVEEGHRAGLTVQVHALSGESVDLAVEAGVDFITHGDFTTGRPLPEETIQKMVKHGTMVSVLPVTQRRFDAMQKYAANSPYPAIWKIAKINRANLRRAGVPFMLSTDAGIPNPLTADSSRSSEADAVDPQFNLGEGLFNALVALEEEGMDRMDILKAATSNIARGYKLDGKLGTLEAGKFADLVVLDANPLDDAHNYRRIHMVIKDGKVVDRDALPTAPLISTDKP